MLVYQRVCDYMADDQLMIAPGQLNDVIMASDTITDDT